MERIELNLSWLSLVFLMIGLLITGCKGDEGNDPDGEDQECILILTAEDVKTFADSLPPGYLLYSWRTNIPTTNFSIYFSGIEDVSWRAPVHLLFEASCRQVPYEGDITIRGGAQTGGVPLTLDLLFVRETTEEILFSADSVWELGTVNLNPEDPLFVISVGLEVRTGGTYEDDLAYLCKVLKQVKVTARYKASQNLRMAER